MDRNVTVDGKKFKSYQLDIIANNYCESIVPASIIEDENEQMIIYNTNGLNNVFLGDSVIECLNLLKCVIFIVEKLEDHLLFKNEFTFDPDSTFFDVRRGTYKVVLSSGKFSFLKYIVEVKDRATNTAKKYIGDIESEVIRRNLTRDEILKLIDRKCEEAYQCEL